MRALRSMFHSRQSLCCAPFVWPLNVALSHKGPGTSFNCSVCRNYASGSADDRTNVSPIISSAKKRYRPLVLAIVGCSTAYALWRYFRNQDRDHVSVLVEKKPSRSLQTGLFLKNPVKLPDTVQYLVIGGGPAGFAACRSIRGADAEAKVLILGKDTHYPYMRPPLSKELWFSSDDKSVDELKFKQISGKERSVFYEKDAFFYDVDELNETKHGGVAISCGQEVVKIDIVNHEAVLSDGSKIKYGKCLIATGGKPKNLDILEKASDDVKSHVVLFRDINDFYTLYDSVSSGENIVVVGGGFLGSELACALSHKAKGRSSVTQLIPEEGNLAKVIPAYLSKWTSQYLQRTGVTVRSNSKIEKAIMDGKKVLLTLNDGETLHADKIIVAIGVNPNVELAKSSSLEVDPEIGGFRCDAELRARTDVYVAGDCCSFYDPLLGRRRVEHQDHAVVSGRLAGENMAGAAKPYKHQSMFWSDLGPDLGFEAIGITDSKLSTVGVFAKSNEITNSSGQNAADMNIVSKQEPGNPALRNGDDFDRGVVFYLNKDKRIVGLLFWNLFGRIPIARKILEEDTVFDDLNDLAKLLNIHDSPPPSLDDEPTPDQK